MLHLAHEQLLLLLSSLVAEGIKTVEVRDRLKELGCNIGQSFYYNEPLPYAEVQLYLARSRPKPRLIA